MRGIMYFSEGGGESIFCKPTLMPTADEDEQLRQRAKAERETIHSKLWNILLKQSVGKNG